MKPITPLFNILSSLSDDLKNKDLNVLYKIVISFKPLLYGWYKKYKLQNKVKDNVKNAGRKSFKIEDMFFLILLKEYYGYSDSKIIDLVQDSKRIGELIKLDKIPSPKTLWHYKKIFANSKISETFFKFTTNITFETCQKYIQEQDSSAANDIKKHVILDSTFLDARCRRDSVETNNKLKQGANKNEIYGSTHVRSHKDTDASFTKKRNQSHFGYKQNVICDAVTKLVMVVKTTTASEHDVNELVPLAKQVKDTAKYLYADTGYIGQQHHEQLKNLGIEPRICRRSTRSSKLSEQDIIYNKKVSKIRCRIEHIFSKHNDKPNFCSYIIKYADMSSLIQYTLYNIKRCISIISGKCKIKSISGDF